ncbi:glycosyl transferase [Streptomyces abyssalis]|uniref:Glycosyl transferase n=1 Tax=Streptomyces abyssalis TaxID=933944 RepID=A0A1E7JK76_9ACTN|nr:glycosyltransferase family 39 protein [Streptomyces abyssalis]OEU88022.1 glycosyl transferase [Streptomyces abyssalis]OEU90884.1 glycosyl transferase [Streptomyces abyssalis]OEV03825.1 glycosyl transferase [Streptomyces nanshensis]
MTTPAPSTPFTLFARRAAPRVRPDRPRWERPAYWTLLALTAVLFLYGLGASGYANSFYSAAAQAGSGSWKAFLFGSLDSGNVITVDKPPAALWPMALSVRLFGLGAWQILLPQALMGVATVAVLYASVRRRFGPAAGLLAGGLMAVTPVAALMFRFNNPDALLCLLCVCAVYCLLRSVEDTRSRWLLLCGVCLGFAFLVKTLQAWLIVPPLVLVHLMCAQASLPRRVGQLLLAGLAMVASAGWWVALAELWPASSRPYIGGSQNNSFLELTLGYNGLGRITGNEPGSVEPGAGRGGGPGGPGGPGGSPFGESGIGRMFNQMTGGQISWLLPAALLLLVAGLLVMRKAARTDIQRAALLAWGGSLLVTCAVFSLMSGIFHEYYTVALAPYIAAVVAMGAVLLWRRRTQRAASAALACAVATTAVWSYVLLGRTGDWLPWLKWAVLAVGLVAALGMFVVVVVPRRVAPAVVGLGLAASVAGPLAYTLSTVGTPHSGAIVTAGPPVARSGPGGGPGGSGGPGGGQAQPDGQGQRVGGQGQFPPGMPDGQGQRGTPSDAGPGRGTSGERGGRMPAGGAMGGLLNGQRVSKAVEAKLTENAEDYKWAAAAIGAMNGATYQLATERPVMSIGGFNGTDPAPTLARFKEHVRDGEIHYFVGGGRSPGQDRRGGSSAITDWVEKHYTKVKIGQTTLYDLTKEKQ